MLSLFLDVEVEDEVACDSKGPKEDAKETNIWPPKSLYEIVDELMKHDMEIRETDPSLQAKQRQDGRSRDV